MNQVVLVHWLLAGEQTPKHFFDAGSVACLPGGERAFMMHHLWPVLATNACRELCRRRTWHRVCRQATLLTCWRSVRRPLDSRPSSATDSLASKVVKGWGGEQLSGDSNMKSLRAGLKPPGVSSLGGSVGVTDVACAAAGGGRVHVASFRASMGCVTLVVVRVHV